MKKLIFALCLLVWASPVSAGLQLSIRDGRVTIDAQDVTVRQILTEWAKIGKTHIVNVERITGAPITLKFENVPEKQALEIVLRAVPGYMAVPRQTFVADASIYDRILLMPTTTAVAAARPAPSPAFPGMQPGMTQLRPTPPALSPGAIPEPIDPGDQDDPAIASAAAAGLIPVPAPTPVPSNVSTPLILPGSAQQPPAQTPPGAYTPANPFAPAGTSAPTFTPPPPQPAAGPTTVPITRPRPPQPDR